MREQRATAGSRQPGLEGLRRAFSSLRIYNYRLYWFGQLVSLTGTWMQRLAQAWLVLNLTHSPFALGTVSTIQFLPITLFSLWGGVIADRIPKRRLLIATQSIAAVQALCLAALTSLGMIKLWEIYILAGALGLSSAFDGPARQAFPVELVGREEVANAVALNSTLFNTSRIAGPSLAGIAIAGVGVAGCFWLNAASFLAVIAALIAMRPSQFFAVPPRQRGSTLQLVRGGLAYAWRTPAIFVLLLALLFMGTFGYNFNVLLPLVARYLLATNSLGYGFLFAALGAGSLAAALTLAYTRAQTLRMVLLGGACFVILLALLGLSHIYPLSLLVLLLLGAASIAYSASTQTRLQVLVPDELRGRVMSLYTLLFAGSTPIGSFFIGGVSQRWGVSTAVVAAALLAAIGLVVAWLYLRTRTAEEMRQGVVSEATLARRGSARA